MFFEEQDATELKAWLVSKLTNISDADSDVLADYVSLISCCSNPQVRDNLEDPQEIHTPLAHTIRMPNTDANRTGPRSSTNRHGESAAQSRCVGKSGRLPQGKHRELRR